MFFGGKKAQAASFDELAGVLLSEKSLMRILQPNFDKRILNITVDAGAFTLNFDQREAVNAVVLGSEDVAKILRDRFSRTIIDVGVYEGGHEQYLVRFEE